MKILLTGSTGMVGNNILEHIDSKKYSFLTPNRSELDLSNYLAVLDYLKNSKADFIIHAAGKVGGIHANIKYPVQYLVENLDMARNLIMASRECGIPKLLNLTSSCMYPKDIDDTLLESMVLSGPLEPTNEGYALAKIFSAKLCEYISSENKNFEYKTIVPCNLFGRFDKYSPEHSHMIPAVIDKIYKAKLSSNDIVSIWGSGEARREFMTASELADFIFYAIQNFSKMPNLLNVGKGKDYSINQYYKVISDVIGYKGKFINDLSKPVGMKRKLLNIDMMKQFGWESNKTLEEGIKETFQYYKNIKNE